MVVAIALTDPIVAAMGEQGLTPPAPHIGYALLDTGASNTSIDDQIAVALGMQVINQTTVATPQGVGPANVYAVRLAFPGTHLPPINFQAVTGMALLNQGISALLGRDFLAGKILHYDGATSQVMLSW